jgi:hypothetical protein
VVRARRLSDETIDGLMLEMALASNPKVKARREAYYARIRASREAIKGKSKADLIAALKSHCPAYITELLEKNDLPALQDRVAYSLQASGTEVLREALGLSSNLIANGRDRED